MYSLKLILFYFSSFIRVLRSYPIDFSSVSINTSFPFTIEALLSSRANTVLVFSAVIFSVDAIVFYLFFSCLRGVICSS